MCCGHCDAVPVVVVWKRPGREQEEVVEAPTWHFSELRHCPGRPGLPVLGSKMVHLWFILPFLKVLGHKESGGRRAMSGGSGQGTGRIEEEEDDL